MNILNTTNEAIVSVSGCSTEYLVSFIISIVGVLIGGVISTFVSILQLKKTNRFTLLFDLKKYLLEEIDETRNILNDQIADYNNLSIYLERDPYNYSEIQTKYDKHLNNFNKLNENKVRIELDIKILTKLYGEFDGKEDLELFCSNVEKRLDFILRNLESLLTRLKEIKNYNTEQQTVLVKEINEEFLTHLSNNSQYRILAGLFEIQLNKSIAFIDNEILKLVK